MAKKIEQILQVIGGHHCMGVDGLRDYHAARAVRDSKRFKGVQLQLAKAKHALNPYPVIATIVLDDACNETIKLRNTVTGVGMEL